MKVKLLICACLLINEISAQVTVKAAFLGNSYTYYNDMPNLIDSIANAAGNDLIHDQNTPGGYTLNGHSTNATSLNLLTSNTWDFVVLQDQSQLPSFPHSQVIADVYPKAKILVDSIRSANECAVPVFFNTWGRENGDQQWDSINTFVKMNNRLYSAYNHMANTNSGIVSPVGLAFKAVYDDPNAVVSHGDLYAGDGSHPTIFGSYLAACIFYNTLFGGNSMGNSYLPSSISQAEANYLQEIAFNVMYMATSPIFDYTYPVATYNFTTSGATVTFNNTSTHAFTYNWDFDDNSSSTVENPVHTYTQNGTYIVKLSAYYCDRVSTYQQTIDITSLGVIQNDQTIQVYPNPVVDLLHFEGIAAKRFELYSAFGQLIDQKDLSGTETTINLSEHVPGLYFVKLISDEQQLTKKVIKK